MYIVICCLFTKLWLLARLLPNGRLGRLSYESGRLKFSSRSPSGRLNMEFSVPPNLSGDLNLLNQKNHSHDKLNKKLPLWSRFALITRNIEQYTFSPAHKRKQQKTAKNSHGWKSPYNALQVQYWIYTSRMSRDCVSVDTLLIQVAKRLIW